MEYLCFVDYPKQDSFYEFEKKYYRIFLGNSRRLLFKNKLRAERKRKYINDQLTSIYKSLNLIFVDLFRFYKYEEFDYSDSKKLHALFFDANDLAIKLHKGIQQPHFIWNRFTNFFSLLLDAVKILEKKYGNFIKSYEWQLKKLLSDFEDIGKNDKQVIFENGRPRIT